jgi:hypothetical protein
MDFQRIFSIGRSLLNHETNYEKSAGNAFWEYDKCISIGHLTTFSWPMLFKKVLKRNFLSLHMDFPKNGMREHPQNHEKHIENLWEKRC